METTRSRDGLYIQYQELESQRRGISPKLSLYQSLTVQMEDIAKQLGGQQFLVKETRKGILQSLNGAAMKVHLRPQGNPKKDTCTHRTVAQKCRIEDCENKTGAQGKCRSCKKSTYRNYCRKHKGTIEPLPT